MNSTLAVFFLQIFLQHMFLHKKFWTEMAFVWFGRQNAMNRCFMFSEVMHVVKFFSTNLTSFSCMSLFDMISQSGPTCKFSLASVTLKLCTITMLQNNVFSQPFHSCTGQSLSEALLFSEHGYNMLCTKIVLNVRNNFCTQHVLPRF